MTARHAATVTWLLVVAMCAAGAVFAGLRGDAAAAATAVVSVAVPTVGAVIARHVPRNPIGWCLLVMGGFMGALGTLGLELAPWAVDHHWPALVAHAAGWVNAWTWVPGLASCLVFTALWFPDGRLVGPRLRPVLGLAVAALVVWFAAMPVAAWLTSTHELVSDSGPAPTGVRRTLQLVAQGAAGVVLLTAVVALGSLVVRWRRTDAVGRQQLKWVAAGIGVVAACLVLTAVVELGAWQNTLVTLSYATVAVAVGVAVLRYRLYDIDRIVSRTVAYTVVTGLLVATYAGLVTALSALLPTRANSFVVAAATLAVAALFVPVRRSVQRSVDRRFNRARYDRVALVDGFAEQLRRDVTHGSDGADLVAVVQRAVEPAHASVWLVSR